jgi:hypothetical protein
MEIKSVTTRKPDHDTLRDWIHQAIANNYASSENAAKGTMVQVRYDSLHREIVDFVLSLLPPDHPMQVNPREVIK